MIFVNIFCKNISFGDCFFFFKIENMRFMIGFIIFRYGVIFFISVFMVFLKLLLLIIFVNLIVVVRLLLILLFLVCVNIIEFVIRVKNVLKRDLF